MHKLFLLENQRFFSLVFLLNNFAVYPVLVKYIAKEDEKDDNTDNGDDEEQIFTDTVK